MESEKIIEYLKNNNKSIQVFVKETWAYIIDPTIRYGDYSISSWGNVWSNISNTMVVQKADASGYMHVSLMTIYGYKAMFRVHNLVGYAFVHRPDPKSVVINHIDGNPSNNVCSNLEWVTTKQNTYHAFQTGLESEKTMYINDGDVRVICKAFEEGKTYEQIYDLITERHPNCDRSKLRGLISNIKQHRAYVHISKDYDIDNKHHNSKYTMNDINDICIMLSTEGMTVKRIMERFNIPDENRRKFQQFLSDIIRGKLFKEISTDYNLKYPIGMCPKGTKTDTAILDLYKKYLEEGLSYDEILIKVYGKEKVDLMNIEEIKSIKGSIRHIKYKYSL